MDEEIIIDRIIDAINNPYNDEYRIEHKPGTNYFKRRLENGRKKLLREAKTLYNSLKIDPSSVLFSGERLGNRLLKT